MTKLLTVLILALAAGSLFAQEAPVPVVPIAEVMDAAVAGLAEVAPVKVVRDALPNGVSREVGDRAVATTVKSGTKIVAAHNAAVEAVAEGTVTPPPSGFARVTNALNPARMVRQVRTNYAEGRFYATNFTQHSTIRQAVATSLRPTDVKTNVKASMRGNMHPLQIVGNIAAPIGMEVQRQICTTGKLDFGKLGRALDPGAIIGGAVGSFAADAAGAAVQSGLASLGPWGAVAGFVARPLISYTGYLVGSNFGRSVAGGKPSFRGALAESMRQVNPMRDAGSLLGGSIGGVVGQAIIPIPVVGYIVGTVVGGVVGTVVGDFLGKHGPTGALNNALMSWLGRKADDIEGKGEKGAEDGTSGNGEAGAADEGAAMAEADAANGADTTGEMIDNAVEREEITPEESVELLTVAMR